MPGSGDAEWLERARIIDQLVRAELRRQGLPTHPKSFDELVASGELQAAECRVMSLNMVTRGWLERPASGSGDKP